MAGDVYFISSKEREERDRERKSKQNAKKSQNKQIFNCKLMCSLSILGISYSIPFTHRYTQIKLSRTFLQLTLINISNLNR